MDNRFKNILPSQKNMISTETDIVINVDLDSTEKNILENKIQKILNLTEQFNLERQTSKKFRLQGQIDCLSHLIGIRKTTTTLTDLFDFKSSDDPDADFYTFKDFFDVVIMYPEKFIKRNDGLYDLILKPLTTASDIDIVNSGFYKNLYYDQIYQFISEKDIDLTEKFIFTNDNRFVLPINNLLLYYVFKDNDPKFAHNWISYNQSLDITASTIGNITTNDLNNGIFGGTYDLDFENFNITLIEEIDYTITLNLSDRSLKYLYNPFKEITLQDYSSNVETGNILTTDNIPYYAYLDNDDTNNNNAQHQELYTITDPIIFSGTTRLIIDDPEFFLPRKLIFNDNNKFYEYYLDHNVYNNNYLEIFYNNTLLVNGSDYILSEMQPNKIILRFIPKFNDQIFVKYLYGENYIWKDLLDIGFFEPDTGIGVDYPFVNGYHYIFSDFKLVIKPDFNDQTTNDLYCKFEFNASVENHTNTNSDEIC